jgi:hypothetical protein
MPYDTKNDGQTDAEPMPNGTATTRQRTASHRSAVTSRPSARLDGNSPVGRRVRDLYKALSARLGDPADIVIQANILAWAELKAAAEVARARLLEGGSNSNELVRIENLCRRAAASVGLEPGSSSEPDEPYGRYGGLFIDDDNNEESPT